MLSISACNSCRAAPEPWKFALRKVLQVEKRVALKLRSLIWEAAILRYNLTRCHPMVFARAKKTVHQPLKCKGGGVEQ